MKSANYQSVFVTVAISLVLNLIAGLILFYGFRLEIDKTILIVTLLILVLLIVFLSNKINRLLFLVNRPKEFPSLTSSKMILINDAVNSLVKYGYLKTDKSEQKTRLILQESKYIRAQNFYYLMKNGVIKMENKFYFINDHPFNPFTQVLKDKLNEKIEIFGINSIPDELYSKEDILNRIDLVNSKKMNYLLMPKEDIHLSMLIFDSNFALVYPTPNNRSVCDFSECLFFEDLDSVKELLKIFKHISSIAKKTTKTTLDSLKKLETQTQFYN